MVTRNRKLVGVENFKEIVKFHLKRFVDLVSYRREKFSVYYKSLMAKCGGVLDIKEVARKSLGCFQLFKVCKLLNSFYSHSKRMLEKNLEKRFFLAKVAASTKQPFLLTFCIQSFTNILLDFIPARLTALGKFPEFAYRSEKKLKVHRFASALNNSSAAKPSRVALQQQTLKVIKSRIFIFTSDV